MCLFCGNSSFFFFFFFIGRKGERFLIEHRTSWFPNLLGFERPHFQSKKIQNLLCSSRNKIQNSRLFLTFYTLLGLCRDKKGFTKSSYRKLKLQHEVKFQLKCHSNPLLFLFYLYFIFIFIFFFFQFNLIFFIFKIGSGLPLSSKSHI